MRNKKKITPARRIFNWIILYVFILIASFIFCYIVTYVYNQNMRTIAQYDKEYYLQLSGEFNPNVPLHRANNVVYDKDNNQIAFYPQSNQTNDWDEYATKLHAKVHAEGEVYKIGINLKADKKFAVIVAMPMDDHGMFLFFREPPFFSKMMLILFVIITAMIFMMAIYTHLLTKMEQKNIKMQRDYVDNITHELKSPIASVKALTETMYDGLIQDEEKRKRYYKIILNEMTGLENTVSNMLELSKIQNDQIDCSKTTLSTYDVFGDIIEKYAALCDDNKMNLSITPDISAHTYVFTNKSLASRIMDILLDNAFKFADRKQGAIRIMFKDDGALLTITIANNGIGIAPEDQKQIFSRFYKGDKSHNEKGSGLGLAIASEIANCLGEKLWLSSTGSNGTAFSFTIHKN